MTQTWPKSDEFDQRWTTKALLHIGPGFFFGEPTNPNHIWETISQTLDLNQLSCPLEQRSNLQSLSKTHVVSKDATQAIAYIVHQPMIASSMHAWACKKIAWDGVNL